MPFSPPYSKLFIIPESAIDENGHVNNVAYVHWMQEIAVEHYASIGGIEAQGKDATWVVREHRIQYFLPAFAGEELEIKTWVENMRRVRLCTNMNLSARGSKDSGAEGNRLGVCRCENRQTTPDPGRSFQSIFDRSRKIG